MDEPDDQDEIAIRALIAETYAATSSGRPGTARYIAHPAIAIAGSGQGELVRGPGSAARMADGVTNLGYLWTPDEISVRDRCCVTGHRGIASSDDCRDALFEAPRPREGRRQAWGGGACRIGHGPSMVPWCDGPDAPGVTDLHRPRHPDSDDEVRPVGLVEDPSSGEARVATAVGVTAPDERNPDR